MDKIKSIWVLLSEDAVQCCNENSTSLEHGKNLMSLELFAKIADHVAENSWKCTVLCNSSGIPKEYLKLCDTMQAQIVMPAEHKGVITDSARTTLVFDSNQMDLTSQRPAASQAILRLRRDHISQLSEIVSALLDHFSNISIRHPDLLSYNDEDIVAYKDELLKIGLWLLNKKELWSRYRIDCLTDRFQLDAVNECGAGVKSIAVGPAGELYLCPACIHHKQSSYGHIMENLKIPNRQLLTREYSVPCGQCESLHCSRCVFSNKRSTFEFCVPARNVCRLTHFEMEAQSWLAQEAIKMGLWNEQYKLPNPPTVYDPYELTEKGEETLMVAASWRSLVKFNGRPKDLQPSTMLEIIHGLQGWCLALVKCAETGYAPSAKTIETDILASLRRNTIEQYRNTVFQEGCPTVHQVELSMCEAANKILNCNIS